MSENLGALQAEVQAGFSSVLGKLSSLETEVAALRADVSALNDHASATRDGVEYIAKTLLGRSEVEEFERKLRVVR